MPTLVHFYWQEERALGRLRQRYIKNLEDRLDNLLLHELLELGINQYETKWNRSDEPALLGLYITYDIRREHEKTFLKQRNSEFFFYLSWVS